MGLTQKMIKLHVKLASKYEKQVFPNFFGTCIFPPNEIKYSVQFSHQGKKKPRMLLCILHHKKYLIMNSLELRGILEHLGITVTECELIGFIVCLKHFAKKQIQVTKDININI